MTTSVATVNVAGRNTVEVLAVLNSLLADVTAIRAAIPLITAKLDGSGGVTDTDYAATCDPAALTTVV